MSGLVPSRGIRRAGRHRIPPHAIAVPWRRRARAATALHRRRRGRTRAGAGHPLRKRTPTSADPPVPERASCAASARLFFLVHALLCSMRFEDGHPKIVKRSQRRFDAPSDLVPRKTDETGAQRRYRYRMEIETTNLPNEWIEPRVDVFQSRAAPPVTLGGEVDAARRISRFGSRLPVDAHRSRSGRGLRPSSPGGSRLGTATHGRVRCPTFQRAADAVANLRRHRNTSHFLAQALRRPSKQPPRAW